MNYFDIAKNVAQTESSFFKSKKAPFQSSDTRFKVKPESSKSNNIGDYKPNETKMTKRSTLMSF